MTAIPKYKTLAETLRSDIVCGLYQNGDALPSENELAVQHQLSRHTVRQAIGLLETESLITRVRGSGTYVSYRKNQAPKTTTVGVVTTYISDYIFPSILNGIEKTLSEKGYSINLSATRNRTENEKRILHEYLEKPVDGLIVEGTKSALPNPNIALYEKLYALGVPIVFINGCYRELKAPAAVLMDDRSGGRQAVEYLLQKGRKKIGGIFKSDDIQGVERYAGYSAAFTDAGLPIEEEMIVWFTTESRRTLFDLKEADALLNRLSGCDAVLCYNDEIASRLAELFTHRRIAIPGQIAIMSFDDSRIAELVAPPLTSMRHAKKEMGVAAAKKLLTMMAGKKESVLYLPWKMAIRQST